MYIHCLLNVQTDGLQYFFPVVREGHWFLFALDLKESKKYCLNSLDCSAVFEDVFKPIGEAAMKIFNLWFTVYGSSNRDIGQFEWSVPSIPVQPDKASCGLFVCWVMEHWVGHIPQSFFSSWVKKEVILQGRRQLVARILTQKENKRLPDITSEAEAWKNKNKPTTAAKKARTLGTTKKNRKV